MKQDDALGGARIVSLSERKTGIAGSREITGADRWGQLMAKAVQGDQQCYNVLLIEISAWLRRYFSRRMPPDAVDDTIQEVLLAVHARRFAYMPSRPFGPWMATIARFKWIDFIRSVQQPKAVVFLDDIAIPDHSATVVASLIVHELLGRLQPQQAEAIVKIRLDGETLEETARYLGTSPTVIKVRVHRSLRKLSAMVA